MLLKNPEPLIIEKTENSPEIFFDLLSKKLLITGESRPENPDLFYEPIISWLNNLDALWQDQKDELQHHSFILQFKLDYFNSTSSKPITDIILSVKKLISLGYPLSMEWHYDKQDEDMLDAGKEFSETFRAEITFVGN